MNNRSVTSENLAHIVTALLQKLNNDINNSKIYNVSQLNNDAKYQTESDVNTKSDKVLSDAKQYAQDLIKVGINFFEFVDKLPDPSNESNINKKAIYFVPKANSKTNNIYDEYVYSNSKWETIGDTGIDFKQYSDAIDDIKDTLQIIEDSMNNDIMKKSVFGSEVNDGAVKKSDSTDKVDGVDFAPVLSYYGKNRNGEVGFHSVPLLLDEKSNNFHASIDNAKSTDSYTIDLLKEREFSDIVCQIYSFMAGQLNQISIVKLFNLAESYNNLYDTTNVSFKSGLEINKLFDLPFTVNSDGLFESEMIDRSVYLEIKEII